MSVMVKYRCSVIEVRRYRGQNHRVSRSMKNYSDDCGDHPKRSRARRRLTSGVMMMPPGDSSAVFAVRNSATVFTWSGDTATGGEPPLTHTHTHTRARARALTHARARTHTHTRARALTHTRARVRAHTHTHIHTHTIHKPALS